MSSFNSDNIPTAVVAPAPSDLKNALNTCKPSAPTYTKISDLREECGYLITSMQRVTTMYGEAIVVILEGLIGEDYSLQVYLPRRYNQVLSDGAMLEYNAGLGERIRLVKHPAKQGSQFTPLEFV